MKILIVTATVKEVELLSASLSSVGSNKNSLKAYQYRNTLIDMVITGVGMALTSYELGKILPGSDYDLALNIGIAGSFSSELPIGTVVNITRDRFGDLGAEDGDEFISMESLGLLDPNEPPFKDSWLMAAYDDIVVGQLGLTEATGITVNTTHGNTESIRKVKEMYDADVESMEGAAFFYCCLKEGIPCIQLRAISNIITERKKEDWNIDLALENLTKCCTDFLDNMEKKEVTKIKLNK